MVKGFLTQDNVYYESMSKLGPNDREVPLRSVPSSDVPPVVTTTSSPPSTMNPQHWPEPPHPAPPGYPPYYYPPGYPHQMQPQTAAPSPPPSSDKDKEKGLLGNVGWKDLITLIYFLSGIAGLWVNMSDRTLILEQKHNAVEKELTSLRETHKEETGKRDAKERSLEARVNELQLIVLRSTEKK